jgi:DNA-binding XRE family transcriptional regulator
MSKVLKTTDREPPLPQPNAQGNFPAVEAARVLLARKIIRRRRPVGLTQADLAKRAGVRVETLSRLEHAKHSPNVATVDRLVHALDECEGVQPAGSPPAPAIGRKGPTRTKSNR